MLLSYFISIVKKFGARNSFNRNHFFRVMPHLNGVGATSVARKAPLNGTLPSGPGKVRHYFSGTIFLDFPNFI